MSDRNAESRKLHSGGTHNYHCPRNKMSLRENYLVLRGIKNIYKTVLVQFFLKVVGYVTFSRSKAEQ